MVGSQCSGAALHSVGKLEWSSVGGFCSGTRISTQVILTAAHCVDKVPGTFTSFEDSAELGASDTIPGATYCPEYSDCHLQWIRDIALYYVDLDPVGKPAGVIANLPDTPGPQDLSSVTMVGFGQPNSGNCYAKASSATDLGADLTTGSGAQPGDSGGPLLLGDVIGDDTAPTVVGVESAVPPPTYTSLLWEGTSSYEAPLQWIKDTIAARDEDGDGVLNEYDKYPDCDNRKDEDGNGIPDDCDPCKGRGDDDHDGVCNPVDNCIGVPNPFQENSNADYEAAQGVPLHGDKCDGTPVGVAQPINARETWTDANCNADGSCLARRNSYEFEVRTVNERQSEGTHSQATGFRFCICENPDGSPVANKEQCRTLYRCGFDHLLFSTPEGIDPLKQTRWFRMTVYKGPPQANAAGTGLLPGNPWEKENGETVEYKNPYSGPLAGLLGDDTWDWILDAQSWRVRGLLPTITPPPGNYPPGEDIPGLMWTHNDSPTKPAAYGMGTTSCDISSPDCGFGNSYGFWNPSERTALCPMPIDPLGKQQVYNDAIRTASSISPNAGTDEGAGSDRILSENSFALALPLIDQGAGSHMTAVRQELVGGLLVNSNFAVPCGVGSNGLAELAISGEPAVIITDGLAPDLRALLRSASTLLVAASEPAELPPASSAPLAVLVNRGNGVLLDGIVQRDGQLSLSPVSREGAVGSLADSPMVVGPTAYSRVTGEVAQLSGSDANAPLDTLRITPVFGDAVETTLQPAALRPWAVRAMAYSGRERLLWLVATDTRSGRQHGQESARNTLVAIGATGRIEMTRELLPSLERFWINVGVDGLPVLVAAPKAGSWYLVGMLRSRDEQRLASGEVIGLVKRHGGEVIGAPRISYDALLVPVRSATQRRPGDRLNPGGLRVEATPLRELPGQTQGNLFVEAQNP